MAGSADLSFQSYFYNDDTFNFNYAQAKAAVGNYKEAEEVRPVIHSTPGTHAHTNLLIAHNRRGQNF